MRRPLLGALVLIAASGRLAQATPCGTDDDDSNSSSDSDTSSNDSDDSSYESDDSSYEGDATQPAVAASTCVDSTQVIGRAECKRFGTWSRAGIPRVRIGMSLTFGTSSTAGMDFDGEVEHQRTHNYHYPTAQVEEAPRVSAGGFEFHLTGGVGEHLHLGYHGAVGVGGTTASTIVVDGLRVDPGGVVQLTNAGVLGTSIPAGDWLLRADAIIGVRSTGISVETRIDDCVKNSTLWNNDLLLEPRVGIEKWLNPWLSAGVMVGTDLMQRRDLSVGVAITAHSVAFDSKRVVGRPQ